MNPKVSVIIPTYNRGPILKNTLLSLGYQTTATRDYEILICDDGSTDETEALVVALNLENLHFLRSDTNRGAAHARNRGISAAEGELLIFCDSDFVVPHTFIENHIKAHRHEQNLAVSGMGHWLYLLTYDFGDEWDPYQDIQSAYQNAFLKERKERATDGHLFHGEDIQKGQFDPFVFCPEPIKEWVSMVEDVIQTFSLNLDGYEFPWLSFCTGNVSVLKENVRGLGGFDESFTRFEDWEFGYRFYKKGGRFKHSQDVEGYQQLTPYKRVKQQIERDCYYKFLTKHPETDIVFFSLILERGMPYVQLSHLFSQHQALLNSESYGSLAQKFEKKMMAYAWKRRDGLTRVRLNHQDRKLRRDLENKRETYNEWLTLFDELVNNSYRSQ